MAMTKNSLLASFAAVGNPCGRAGDVEEKRARAGSADNDPRRDSACTDAPAVDLQFIQQSVPETLPQASGASEPPGCAPPA